MKGLIITALLLFCPTTAALAESSHYIRQEHVISFDGKVTRVTVSYKLYIANDVNPQDYSMERIGVPIFGKLKNVDICLKSDNSKPRTFHKKDAIVMSDRPPYALVSDAEYYLWNLGAVRPPCQIECSYELEEPDALGGNFIPVVSELPVDTAIVIINFPADKWRLKYSLDRATPAFVDSTKKAVFTRYDLPALDKSPYKKAPHDFIPGLWYLFESKTDIPDISDWNDVYIWAKDRIEKEQVTLDSAKMLSTASTPEDILAAINNQCHYVAIELGKGSYVPDPSRDVWSRGYGDCKGLATLFMNWMKAVGYDSWQVLVSADDNYYGNIEFPSPGMFDHMIAAYVATNGDTIYQDLTAEFCPLGFLPTELYGCLAFPLKSDAQPFRLGAAPVDPDTLDIRVAGNMTADGVLVGTMNLMMKGRSALQWNYIHGFTRTIDNEKMIRTLLEEMMPTMLIRRIDLDSAGADEIKLSGPINIRRFCVQRDSITAFKPWSFEFLRGNLDPDSSRIWPTVLKRNLLCQIDYLVRLNEPVFSKPGRNSTNKDFENFSYKFDNNSHDDSLIIDFGMHLQPAILSPQSFNEYIDERKGLLRDIDSGVTFIRKK